RIRDMVSLTGDGHAERDGFRLRPRGHPHTYRWRSVVLVFLSLRDFRRRIPHLRLLRDGRRREHGVDADADNRNRCDLAELHGPGPGDLLRKRLSVAGHREPRRFRRDERPPIPFLSDRWWGRLGLHDSLPRRGERILP